MSAGWLGGNSSGGAITASYATGSVSGNFSRVGGLVGYDGGAITDSYWNTDIFGAGTDGVGKTTAQLQSPTGYTGIYRDWNADLDNADGDDDDATGADDFWDFGASSQYPALKADFDGDGNGYLAGVRRPNTEMPLPPHRWCSSKAPTGSTTPTATASSRSATWSSWTRCATTSRTATAGPTTATTPVITGPPSPRPQGSRSATGPAGATN